MTYDDFTFNDLIFHRKQIRTIKIKAQTIRPENSLRIAIHTAVSTALDLYNMQVSPVLQSSSQTI